MKDILVNELNRPQVEETVKKAMAAFPDIELVELRYFKEFGKFNLTVFIWKKEGITLDDCESVHNAVSSALDEIQDLFSEDYILNVSSQGLDRQIKTDDDLRRALDTEIQIFEDKKKTHGILVEYDKDNIHILSGSKTIQNKIISRKQITKIQPYIRF